jgi:hypothetical protein
MTTVAILQLLQPLQMNNNDLDIRYIIGMLLCYIALFDLIRKSDLFIFCSDKWHPAACHDVDNWQCT